MAVLRILRALDAFSNWNRRGFTDFAPQFVKESVLQKHGIAGAPWVETGTYMGSTTKFLAARSPKVITLEPEPKLFARARRRFARTPGVEVINGTSEAVFPTLLPQLAGDLNFWLDGHYSAGVTFRGDKDCPVEDELAAIAANLDRFGKVAIMIDDVRCFLPDGPVEYASYPTLDSLVDWARRHGFHWRIEQDILILHNFDRA